ncbi:MAG: MBL fold metallo-hydrolase [Prevotella sp.]|jgi:L-ascorbate metabolism protein UlaG (beta-lactamase superfamily)|nr:MBL fold metallo-hydrolase [Prevotella sp.]
MKKYFVLSFTIVFCLFTACGNKSAAKANSGTTTDSLSMATQSEYIKADVYETNKGPLKVTLVGHGSVMFEYGGKIIQVDPYSKIADYSKLPKADLIILTHEHADHLDTVAINAVKRADTHYIVSKVCNEILKYGDIMNNGDKTVWSDISIEAVPAYNIVNKNPQGGFYHPKGRGNGYVFSFGDKKVYVAGDTENIPEMDRLKGSIDIAFLPKNLPYTMNDDMFVDAAKKVRPKVLYPYHMSEFDNDKISKALDGTGITLEVRPMKN